MNGLLSDYFNRSLKKGGYKGIFSLPRYLLWVLMFACVSFFDMVAQHIPFSGFRELVYKLLGYNLGKGVYIAEGVRLDRAYRKYLEIGDGTSIMFNTVILCHQRDLKHYKSGDWFRECSYKIAPVKIGKKVFIGPNCVVLPGTQIGDGAVVGAGSVVHGIIPAYTLAMGTPARILKKY